MLRRSPAWLTRRVLPTAAIVGLISVAETRPLPAGPQQAASGNPAGQQSLRKVITGDNTRLPTTDTQLLRIRFGAGARTYWHRHEEGHLLLVEEGRGRYQLQGHKAVELGPGQIAYLPAHVPHWHGAAPDASATLLTVYPHGVKITMMEEVSEAEYRAGAVSGSKH